MKKQKYPEGYFIGFGIAIGIAIGSGIGVALGNIALGIPIGLSIGVAIGVSLEEEHKKRGEIKTPTKEESEKNRKILWIFLLIGLITFLSVLALFILMNN